MQDAAGEVELRDEEGGIRSDFLHAVATAIDEGEWNTLYRTSPPKEAPATLTALPYYLWANRGQGSMLVWIPEA